MAGEGGIIHRVPWDIKRPPPLKAHAGTSPCAAAAPMGARPDDMDTCCCCSCSCSFFLRFLAPASSPSVVAAAEEGDYVGTFSLPPTETAMAGTVPVPVVAMMAGIKGLTSAGKFVGGKHPLSEGTEVVS
ncbi:hypothetical protein Taro_051453 [Colocasia esculenta]|uniref:Uncharacterized protein n=1 Tax=Colocasia esculenta TaxID=4460 RepID=A0A843XGX5_COLES|nr:hypothetical protein [Colocasia esculenta]